MLLDRGKLSGSGNVRILALHPEDRSSVRV